MSSESRRPWAFWGAALALGLVLAPTGASAGDLQVTVLDKDGNPAIDAVVLLQVTGNFLPAKPLLRQAVISQERMRFLPPVTLLPLGGKARFENNDPWEHHVRGSAAGILQFNASAADGFENRLDGRLPGKPPTGVDVSLEKVGPVLLGCHIHASMRGYIYVTDTPWAAVTDAEGRVRFDAVPNGSTQVKVWHADQLLDVAPQTLTVGAAPAQLSVRLTVVPRKRKV